MKSKAVVTLAGVLVVSWSIGAEAQNPPAPAPAQAAPSTDIYVYHLGGPAQGRIVNITNRTGYDNQPAWDDSALVWTSQRDGQTDIYQSNLATSGAGKLTDTPESEYSAAVAPDGSAITVVRVERDSTQRLWRFPKFGGAPSVVLRDIKPVGYFAWLDSTTLALFVLGNPNTLQIADTRTGLGKVVTTGIGRSLQRVPGSRRASFTQRIGGKTVLLTVDASPRPDGSFAVDRVATLPDSADYVVWKTATHLYTAAGSRLLQLRLPSREWELVADLSSHGIRRISRLALSSDGGTLALVAEEPRSR